MAQTQSPLNLNSRTIYCSDNLPVLEGINSDCIDLIYLDPPFNKKKTFTAPIGSAAEGAEFADIFREEDVKDEWVKSIEFENPELHNYLQGVKGYSSRYNYCYLVYMAIRLLECRRILKDTGSIYLHCDSTMGHYLKVLLDCIFGEGNFRNEIVWHYYNVANVAKRHAGRKHDVIFYYAKSGFHAYNYHQMREPYEEGSNWVKAGGYANDARYAPNPDGKLLHDVWRMPSINNMSSERTGYPTQKPLALMERIIRASSNPGDMVLDPFCGCATTCVAAESLQRQWVGIDVSDKAYVLVNERLRSQTPSGTLAKDEQPNFSTVPPKRDAARSAAEGGYIYVISNPAFPDRYKVGIAKDVQRRLNSFQTSDPDRGYKVEYQLRTQHYKAIETSVHATFPNQHEWVNAALADIVAHIKKEAGN